MLKDLPHPCLQQVALLHSRAPLARRGGGLTRDIEVDDSNSYTRPLPIFSSPSFPPSSPSPALAVVIFAVADDVIIFIARLILSGSSLPLQIPHTTEISGASSGLFGPVLTAGRRYSPEFKLWSLQPSACRLDLFFLFDFQTPTP